MSSLSACWPQWVAAIAVFEMTSVMSLESGWTSPALAILLSPDSPIPTSEIDASWIVSLLGIGRAVGSLIGTIEVEIFGSKTTVLHVGFMQVLGLLLLGAADTVILIQISRFISGVASGMLLIAFPLYMGEISNPKIRGALIGFASSGRAIGYVCGNLTGAYMSILDFVILPLVLSVLFIITFYWLPKSPHYLALKDKAEEAGAAIMWYQRDAEIKKELESLLQFIKANQQMSFKEVLDVFMLPHNRTALFNVVIIHILIQASGHVVVGAYTEIILTQAQVTFIPVALAVAISSCAAPIGSIMAMFTIDRFGRKIVMAMSTLGLAVCLSAMSIHFQLLETGWIQPEHLQWLMLTATIMLEVTINLGLLPVPSTIVSEIFAPNIKSYSSCIVNVVAGLSGFVVMLTYQMLVDVIDFYIYFVYAGCMVVLAVFTIFMLPETKGKSLQEIQTMLMKK